MAKRSCCLPTATRPSSVIWQAMQPALPLQTFSGDGIEWYSVSTVAADPPGFGTITTAAAPAAHTGKQQHAHGWWNSALWAWCRFPSPQKWSGGPASLRDCPCCSLPPCACPPTSWRCRPPFLGPINPCLLPSLHPSACRRAEPHGAGGPYGHRQAAALHLTAGKLDGALGVCSCALAEQRQQRSRFCVHSLAATWCTTPCIAYPGCAAHGFNPPPAHHPDTVPTLPLPPHTQPRIDAPADLSYLRRYFQSSPPTLAEQQDGSSAAANGDASGAPQEPQELPSYHSLQQRCWKLPGWAHYRSRSLEMNLMGAGRLPPVRTRVWLRLPVADHAQRCSHWLAALVCCAVDSAADPPVVCFN